MAKRRTAAHKPAPSTAVPAWRSRAAVVATAVLAALCIPTPPGVLGVVAQAAPVMAIAAGLVVGVAYLQRRGVPRDLVAVGAMVVLGGIMLWSVGILPSVHSGYREELMAWYRAPISAESHAFDGGVYLRTRELMEAGEAYYAAFARAVMDRQDVDTPPAGALNYRQPLLFWVWTALPGPPVALTILHWYLVAAFAGIGVAFMLARRFVEDAVALAAPFILLPRIATSVLTMSWFAFPEEWAAVFVVAAFALLVWRRWWWSIAALLVAVAMRELAVLFVPAWVVVWAMAGARKRMLPGLLVTLAGPVVIIGAHVLAAPVDASTAFDISPWLVGGGIPRLVRALQHNADYAPIGWYLQPALLALALAGAALARARWLRWALIAGIVAPTLFLSAFSANEFDYYWGGILIPLLAAVAPLAAQQLTRPRST